MMNVSRNKIRICHVQVLPLMSGVQRAMLALFDRLDRERFEPHVVCQGAGPLTDELDARQISWHAVPELDRPIRPLADYRAYRSLHALFRRERFEIVHTHSSKPGILARVAARKAGIPCVVHQVHAFAFHEYSEWHQRLVYSRLEKWAGRYCDRVLFVNHEEHGLATRSGWLPAKKCHTVYNGVDLSHFHPDRCAVNRTTARRLLGLRDDEMIVVVNGRLAYPKQPHLIPEVAARLSTIRPNLRWRFVVVGDGEERGAVEAKLTELSLQDRVRMLGWRDDSLDAYAAADVVLMTSLAEGLPLALIEAQACGLPIVAGNAKGVREVVTDDTGFLCTPTNPAAYASHLAMLIDSKVLRTQMGYHARKRAEKLFDTVVNNRQIVAVYEELLAEKGIGKNLTAFTGVAALHQKAA